MEELSKADAVTVRENYKSVYDQIKTDIWKHFYNMDFMNADKRAEMEDYIKIIEQKCDAQISVLDAIIFE